MGTPDSDTIIYGCPQHHITVKGQVYERFYQDSCVWHDEQSAPEILASERAYRDAFLLAAREASQWPHLDTRAIDRAWQARRSARRAAEVRSPSADYFGITDRAERRRYRSVQIAYRLGHRVDFSWRRGWHHGLELLRQGWMPMIAAGVPDALVRVVIANWLSGVECWHTEGLAVAGVKNPPRPLWCLTPELEQALTRYAVTECSYR